ncbi:MAG TPA: hypothetical protein VF586_12860 [Pyrinomonadaceae bacterium]|jgi:hypothetical protein
MRQLPGVDHVVRVSEEYRVVGRHRDDERPTSFDYKGVRFGQDTLHVFAGLCAVDTRESVERMGGVNGRVYTITFKATDASGDVSTPTAKVTVPRSQNGTAAVDDAPRPTVLSGCP